MKDYSHIHIGAGKLGLGLVLDVTSKLNFRTLVLNHENHQKRKLYSHLRNKKEYALSTGYTIKGFDLALYRDSNPQTCAKYFEDPSLSLITTSVNQLNLKAAAQLIAYGLLKRQSSTARNKPLAIMACENIEYPSYELINEIREVGKTFNVNPSFDAYLEKVAAVNVVVDRICGEPELKTSSRTTLTVPVESHCEWIIDDTELANKNLYNLITIMKGNRSVKVVHKNLYDLYMKRKFWCFNGIDLCASIYAYNYGYLNNKPKVILELRDAVNDKIIKNKIQSIQKELLSTIVALAEKNKINETDFSKGGMTKYNDLILKRLSEFKPNPIMRIINDFVKMARAPAVMDDFQNHLKLNDKRKIKQELRHDLLKLINSLDSTMVFHKLQQRIITPIKIGLEIGARPKYSIQYLHTLIEIMKIVSNTNRNILVKKISDI